jgi:hypothetical protein
MCVGENEKKKINLRTRKFNLKFVDYNLLIKWSFSKGRHSKKNFSGFFE